MERKSCVWTAPNHKHMPTQQHAQTHTMSHHWEGTEKRHDDHAHLLIIQIWGSKGFQLCKTMWLWHNWCLSHVMTNPCSMFTLVSRVLTVNSFYTAVPLVFRIRDLVQPKPTQLKYLIFRSRLCPPRSEICINIAPDLKGVKYLSFVWLTWDLLVSKAVAIVSAVVIKTGLLHWGQSFKKLLQDEVINKSLITSHFLLSCDCFKTHLHQVAPTDLKGYKTPECFIMMTHVAATGTPSGIRCILNCSCGVTPKTKRGNPHRDFQAELVLQTQAALLIFCHPENSQARF